MSEVELREATPADRDRILELMRLSLGEGGIPRHLAYWRWKHEENPFGHSPCLLATNGAEIVGLRVFMRWSWLEGGREVSAVRAVDTATHTDWRGRGIFSRLTLRLLQTVEEEGVAMIFNTPNEKSRPGYLKMGWESVGRVSVWIRPMRPGRLVSTLLSADSPDAGSHDEEEGGAGGAPDVGEEPIELFDHPDLEGFLGGVAISPRRLTTPRSAEYLRWRYARIPGIEYRAVWSIDGSSGAIVFLRLRKRGRATELRLCDVIVGSGPSSVGTARKLIRGLVGTSRADFASAMTVTGAGVPSVLGATGFVPAPRTGPIMTVRRLAGQPTDLDPVRRSAWHLSIGDLELF